MLKVYHYTFCPFSRKLRVVLSEKNIDFSLREEKYWENNYDFMKINPSGMTPAVLFENNTSLNGTHTLFEYFEKTTPIPALLPSNSIEQAKVRSLVEWFDNKFYQEITKHIFTEKILKTILHNNKTPVSSRIRAAKSNLVYHLDYMKFLLKNNTYLFGEKLTIADISAASQISILDYTHDINWEKNIKVKSWYSLIKSRPSFRSILQDRIIELSPPSHYLNPDF